MESRSTSLHTATRCPGRSLPASRRHSFISNIYFGAPEDLTTYSRPSRTLELSKTMSTPKSASTPCILQPGSRDRKPWMCSTRFGSYSWSLSPPKRLRRRRLYSTVMTWRSSGLVSTRHETVFDRTITSLNSASILDPVSKEKRDLAFLKSLSGSSTIKWQLSLINSSCVPIETCLSPRAPSYILRRPTATSFPPSLQIFRHKSVNNPRDPHLTRPG